MQNVKQKLYYITMVALTVLPLKAFSQAKPAEVLTAEIFSLKGDQEKPLYSMQVITQVEGSSKEAVQDVKLIYKDPQSAVLVEESGKIADSQVLDYQIIQRQLNKSGSVSVFPDKIIFEVQDSSGKKKTKTEKRRGYLLTNLNFSPFVEKNWENLMKGQKLEVHYAVWDRLETIVFTLKKEKEELIDKQKNIVLVFKPNSLLIAALVDPVYLWYNLETKKISQMKGRVPVLQSREGKLDDFDGKVVYQSLKSPTSVEQKKGSEN